MNPTAVDPFGPEVEELDRLNDTLPGVRMSRENLEALVRDHGVEFARRRLIGAHLDQCRTLCPHLGGADIGA